MTNPNGKREIGLGHVEDARAALAGSAASGAILAGDFGWATDAQIVRSLAQSMISLTTTLVEAAAGNDLGGHDCATSTKLAIALRQVRAAMSWLADENPDETIYRAFADKVVL